MLLPYLPLWSRNEQLEHENRQQAILIAELEGRNVSLLARMEAVQQHSAALHRYAVANGAAYGRLAAHATGLHEQLAGQLGSLLSLCRHLSLQLNVALAAADPLATLDAASGSSSAGGSSSSGAAGSADISPQAAHSATPQDSSTSAAAVAAATLSIQGIQTELQVAVRLLEMQAGSSEAAQLAGVPADIAAALASDLAGLPASLLTSPRLEPAELQEASSGKQGPAALGRPCRPSACLTVPLPAGVGQQPENGAAAAPPAPDGAQIEQQAQQGQQTHPSSKQPLQQLSQQPSPQAQQQPSILSAQVAQLEAHLERLVRASTEHGARAAAATQLHCQEQELRQRAEDLAARLAAHLAATQVPEGVACSCVAWAVGAGVVT